MWPSQGLASPCPVLGGDGATTRETSGHPRLWRVIVLVSQPLSNVWPVKTSPEVGMDEQRSVSVATQENPLQPVISSIILWEQALSGRRAWQRYVLSYLWQHPMAVWSYKSLSHI